MSFLKRVLGSKLFWGLLLGTLIIRSFMPYKEKSPPISPGKEGVTLYDATLVGRDQQGRLWEVRAGEIWQSKEGKVMDCRAIERVTVFRRDEGDWDFSFCSDWAHMETEKDYLAFGGRIRGETKGGSFTTEEAVVNLETRDITCPQPVVYVRDNLTIEARRMEGNLKTEELLFTGEVIVEKNRDYYARGETLRYWGKEERYELVGGVELEL